MRGWAGAVFTSLNHENKEEQRDGELDPRERNADVLIAEDSGEFHGRWTMSWLGRNAVIGLGVGVTISTGLIALFIIKEALRRRNRRRLLLHNTSSALQNETGMNQKTSHSLTYIICFTCVWQWRVCVCSVDSSAVSGLSPELQVELRKTLDEVMKSVSSLRNEIAELREGLRDISTTIAEDVKCVNSFSSSDRIVTRCLVYSY